MFNERLLAAWTTASRDYSTSGPGKSFFFLLACYSHWLQTHLILVIPRFPFLFLFHLTAPGKVGGHKNASFLFLK